MSFARNLVLSLACLTLVGAGLFRVWVYQEAVQLGYRLSEREDELRRLRNDVRQLEVEAASERSPAHLAELARTLGLEPTAPRLLQNDGLGTHRAAPVVASGGRHGRP